MDSLPSRLRAHYAGIKDIEEAADALENYARRQEELYIAALRFYNAWYSGRMTVDKASRIKSTLDQLKDNYDFI